MNASPTASTGIGSGKTFFSDAVTTVAQIKATQGQIYLLDLMNGTAATAYLQVFFKPAASVTLGTTVADMTIKLPTNGGSGFRVTIPFPVPVGAFGLTAAGSGLSVAGTTTATGSTTAAIGVTAVFM